MNIWPISSDPIFNLGLYLSVASTITWAFGTLYTKKKAASFNPYFSLGLQMLISSVCLFAFTGATGTNIPLTANSCRFLVGDCLFGRRWFGVDIHCFHLCLATFTYRIK